ncbi:glutamine--tRNA ligase [Clostridia bacterium]|nr:glutamine--tRNA ligase [Clostridia bacterium]
MYIQEDLGGRPLQTRFPPEPNGYLHIGHAKSICLNFELARRYGGKCNLRFDDTNPAKESDEFVRSIQDDIRWLGFDWGDRLFYASDYFAQMYEYAIELIKKGKAFVCDLTTEQLREYKGSWDAVGSDSPYRNRTTDENLSLFAQMKNGEFPDGAKTLRAKIDMGSPNINLRDPVLYRIARIPHQRTGGDWCVYPMYDYAHPIEDIIEGVTHSICTLEFEEHRPLYDWITGELAGENKPRQIEFAKLSLSRTIMGKRSIAELVAKGVVDGWDDPRLPTISGLRRRGCTPSAIRAFCEEIGVSKANSTVDCSMFEHFVREDLKNKAKVVMVVLDPLKLVITNYEKDGESFVVENNAENPELGTREVTFSRELYIEREDFAENPPKKFRRLTVGGCVRLKSAYVVVCDNIIKDSDGNVSEIHCTYIIDKEDAEVKPKSAIQWVNKQDAVSVSARLYDSLINEDGTKNGDALTVIPNAMAEKSLEDANSEDRFQFMRIGYFCIDSKYSDSQKLAFNRTLPLKNSFKTVST